MCVYDMYIILAHDNHMSQFFMVSLSIVKYIDRDRHPLFFSSVKPLLIHYKIGFFKLSLLTLKLFNVVSLHLMNHKIF